LARRTLAGITEEAAAAGYALLLEELPRYDLDDTAPIFEALVSRHVDGIIWAVPEVGANRNWIDRRPVQPEVPIVYLTMEPRQNMSAISIDNYLGGRLAMEHLLAKGFRNIAHVAGPLDWWEARQRMAAWRDALQDAGLEAGDKCWAEGDWSSTSGEAAADKLFQQYPEMDAACGE
jgi:LacI family transcriptional regulator